MQLFFNSTNFVPFLFFCCRIRNSTGKSWKILESRKLVRKMFLINKSSVNGNNSCVFKFNVNCWSKKIVGGKKKMRIKEWTILRRLSRGIRPFKWPRRDRTAFEEAWRIVGRDHFLVAMFRKWSLNWTQEHAGKRIAE